MAPRSHTHLHTSWGHGAAAPRCSAPTLRAPAARPPFGEAEEALVTCQQGGPGSPALLGTPRPGQVHGAVKCHQQPPWLHAQTAVLVRATSTREHQRAFGVLLLHPLVLTTRPHPCFLSQTPPSPAPAQPRSPRQRPLGAHRAPPAAPLPPLPPPPPPPRGRAEPGGGCP